MRATDGGELDDLVAGAVGRGVVGHVDATEVVLGHDLEEQPVRLGARRVGQFVEPLLGLHAGHLGDRARARPSTAMAVRSGSPGAYPSSASQSSHPAEVAVWNMITSFGVRRRVGPSG